MEHFLLTEGVKMPILGLGTYKIKGYELILQVLDDALTLGYRSFDTAQVYGNESDIGQSLEILLAKHQLTRTDIFITSKIAPYNQGDKCSASVEQSLSNLRTDYIDLMLIHWPGSSGIDTSDTSNIAQRKRTWQALESFFADGRLKAIGVSNYTRRHMDELFSHAKTKPHLLQSEFHPLLNQQEMVNYCKSHSVVFQAYSSLGTSDSTMRARLLSNELIVQSAKKYAKTPAQVLLRWALQQHIGIIPKASSFAHLQENMNVFDFVISEEDMAALGKLDQQCHLCWNPESVV